MYLDRMRIGETISAGTAPLGLLLAGGASRRMGGEDKGSAVLGGRPLAAIVADRLRPGVAELVISANRPIAYSDLATAVLPDDRPGQLGPLAGLLTAMTWCGRSRPHLTDVLMCSVDAPFIPRDLVARLTAARRTSGADVAIAASGRHRHPTIGLFAVALADDLAAALDAGHRKVGTWIDRQKSVIVSWDVDGRGDAEFDPFFNVNTLEDLARARALLERHPEFAP
jgi:molybdopterin-guanine dinucleotide biosynthesis protein A